MELEGDSGVLHIFAEDIVDAVDVEYEAIDSASDDDVEDVAEERSTNVQGIR